jgi:hypothetical protein
MSFIPQSKTEWIGQLKLPVLILAMFGYLIFLLAGWSTGLGVIHNPSYCWVASAFAIAVASGSQRWVALMALVVSVFIGAYGYHDNAAWRKRLSRWSCGSRPASS